MSHVMISTTETIAGKDIEETLGIVRGNTIRARHVGRDILAGLKNIVGGELHDYTKLMAEAREQSIDRMIDEARDLGADAIVGVRFATSVVAQSAAEILVFGTAVKLKD
ncbi:MULTISPECIES: YbjQ family protein [Gammaproteobacteria]|uniref:YbjQ family protein n=1 Tax=Gammaproteobacteria TaxID=1236 RepID=UPI000DD011BA|nr:MULTISPECIES: YbjQ family protein [Gammaproteobacteria]RTE85795.1 YbjQ family protein [Aliidiomarina sp. B3213]TCZ90203.1 YbjQ family protein [Lysobacter sp. N42]